MVRSSYVQGYMCGKCGEIHCCQATAENCCRYGDSKAYTKKGPIDPNSGPFFRGVRQ